MQIWPDRDPARPLISVFSPKQRWAIDYPTLLPKKVVLGFGHPKISVSHTLYVRSAWKKNAQRKDTDPPSRKMYAEVRNAWCPPLNTSERERERERERDNRKNTTSKITLRINATNTFTCRLFVMVYQAKGNGCQENLSILPGDCFTIRYPEGFWVGQIRKVRQDGTLAVKLWSHDTSATESSS